MYILHMSALVSRIVETACIQETNFRPLEYHTHTFVEAFKIGNMKLFHNYVYHFSIHYSSSEL